MDSGRYCAYSQGYDKDPVMGSLQDVQAALGQSVPPSPRTTKSLEASKTQGMSTFNVTLTFQHPAWDEREGLLYEGIVAASKTEANRKVRAMAASYGHTYCRGRIYLKATKTSV